MLFTAPVCALLSGQAFDPAAFMAVVPLGLVNCANIVSGLFGTGGLSVPMFIVLRRFTMVITVAIERLVYKQSHDWQVPAAIAVMIAGAITAAVTDLGFTLAGYTALLINDLFTAGNAFPRTHVPEAVKQCMQCIYRVRSCHLP